MLPTHPSRPRCNIPVPRPRRTGSGAPFDASVGRTAAGPDRRAGIRHTRSAPPGEDRRSGRHRQLRDVAQDWVPKPSATSNIPKMPCHSATSSCTCSWDSGSPFRSVKVGASTVPPISATGWFW